jgi:hypothetical protein
VTKSKDAWKENIERELKDIRANLIAVQKALELISKAVIIAKEEIQSKDG